jgi:hypothetical protein
LLAKTFNSMRLWSSCASVSRRRSNTLYKGPSPFPQRVTIYPDNAHLALVRQFTHEVLVSAQQFAWPVTR